MILLDTDILSLVLTVHPRVSERMQSAPEPPNICVVTRIEVLQGRFDSVLKAANAEALYRAQDRLEDMSVATALMRARQRRSFRQKILPTPRSTTPVPDARARASQSRIQLMKRQAYGFRDHAFFKLKILGIHETRHALVG